MSIKVNLKIFLFAIVFYLTKQIEIYALLMLFAIIHELGHLLCGLAMGLKPKSLKIMPLGLCIEFSTIPRDYPKKKWNTKTLATKKMLIALAGPFTNVLLIGFCFFISTKIPYFDFKNIVYANILIAVFNLMPIYPLDGGRTLYYFLQRFKGTLIATQVVCYLSNTIIIILTAIASIAILYYQNVAIPFIIFYLWYLVIVENKKYHIKMKMYHILQKEEIRKTIKEIDLEEVKSTI